MSPNGKYLLENCSIEGNALFIRRRMLNQDFSIFKTCVQLGIMVIEN